MTLGPQRSYKEHHFSESQMSMENLNYSNLGYLFIISITDLTILYIRCIRFYLKMTSPVQTRCTRISDYAATRYQSDQQLIRVKELIKRKFHKEIRSLYSVHWEPLVFSKNRRFFSIHSLHCMNQGKDDIQQYYIKNNLPLRLRFLWSLLHYSILGYHLISRSLI